MLRERIRTIKELLQAGRLANEAAVSSGVVLPILDALGWPAFDPSTVAPEYGVGKRRVDFALVTNGTPAVFVEVKQPGRADGADRQLFEYAFHEGVPLAILTDGATWHFYVPALQGSYDERRVYLLDLLERQPAESEARLQRYLARDAVESGEAFERARQDYQRAKQRKGAATAIPQAWANLIASQDPSLQELMAREVESVSGYALDEEDLWAFLKGLEPTDAPLPRGRPPRPKPPPEPGPGPEPVTPSATGDSSLPSRGVQIGDDFYPQRNGADVLRETFRQLARRDPDFLRRFAALPEHGKRRRYLARSPEELFPGRPDLASNYKNVVEIADGYLLGGNLSLRSIEKVIRMAADVAGLEYGTDLCVRLSK